MHVVKATTTARSEQRRGLARGLAWRHLAPGATVGAARGTEWDTPRMILGRSRSRVGKTPGRTIIGRLIAEQDRYPELIQAFRESILLPR